MNSANIALRHSPAARARKSKTRKPHSTKKNGSNGEPHLAAAGSLTRTKALLLAALRVWELKHRIGE